MNAARRKRVAAIKTLLEELQEKAADIREQITALADEEAEARDSLPESLMLGEQGDRMQHSYDSLQQAGDDVDEIDTAVESIVASLDAAI